MTRIDNTAGSDQGTAALLGFAAGNERWLIDLADAGEVLPVPVLCEVPLTKPWFRGIANIRGMFYSVTDLSAFLGGASTPTSAQARLLLTGADLRQRQGNADVPVPVSHMSLLMARTFGMKPRSSLEEVHDMPGRDRPWFGRRFRDGEGEVWTCLVLSELMTATEFLDIAA